MISAGDSATVEPGIALDLIEDEAFFQDCEQLYTPKPSIGQVEAIACSSEPGISRQLLSTYYGRLFPIRRLLRWLAYGNDKRYLANREFSFTLENDVYLRYLSFDGPESFQTRLSKDVPIKIDIGAVYSSRPSERKTLAGANFRPVEHELVFDLDMTDYDDVRSCCRDKSICEKCWKFLAIAAEILDQALREDFGFESILWVFSGRRGMHCWVADSRARQLSGASRKAVLTYLELSKSYGSDLRRRGGASDGTHHAHIERSLKIVKENWIAVALEDQKILSTESGRKLFISKIADDGLRGQISKLWSDPSVAEIASAVDYWNMFLDLTITAGAREAPGNNHRKISEEVQIKYLYPRLDTNVSLQMNHLLKSPFCAHPSTGKICVPFRVSEVWEFDPLKVPNLSQVIGNEQLLEPYLAILDEFLETLGEARQQKIAQLRADSQKTLVF